MKTRVRAITLIALMALSVTPFAAGAETRLSVTVGNGYDPNYYRHHHHRYYSDWDRPVYVVPPPVIYAPPPMALAPSPSVAYAPPYAAGLNAAQTSPTFVDKFGRSCREYQTSVNIGGTMRPAYGTACLQPDGSWRVVE
ncbi:MAG: hypothetical protein WCF85_03900 [Rhodospirillaceae bacterium]